MTTKRLLRSAALLTMLWIAASGIAKAAAQNACDSLPNFSALKAALGAATSAETSGLNNQMWATIVDRDGVVCAVAFSAVNRGAQWPSSRVISAQKANTATAFSLDSTSNSGGSGQPNGLALSTANLYSAVQPGGSLFGLQESNPVDTNVACGGPSSNYGTAQDPRLETRLAGLTFSAEGLRYTAPAKNHRWRWGQRRHFLCGPQHCLASTQKSRLGSPFGREGSFRRSHPSRQYRL